MKWKDGSDVVLRERRGKKDSKKRDGFIMGR